MESNHKSGDGLSGTQKEAALRALVQRTGYSLVQVGTSCDMCWDPPLDPRNGGSGSGPKMQIEWSVYNSLDGCSFHWERKLHHFSFVSNPEGDVLPIFGFQLHLVIWKQNWCPYAQRQSQFWKAVLVDEKEAGICHSKVLM